MPGAPHEVLLVLDATVGQNGLAQAREFTNVAGVNGIVLTKLDGTAKGGVAVAIAHDLKLPIRYVGVGEGIDDLLPFSPHEYVDASVRGEVVSVTDAATTCERALFHARARPRAHQPESAGRRGRRVAGRRRRRPGLPRARGRAARRGARARRGGRARARRDAVLHARAVLPHRPHRPCVERIVDAGIARVVAAIEDPNPRVSGQGLRRICARTASRSRSGVGDERARRLNQRVLHADARRGRPFVILKAAISVDGCIAAAPGRRTQLTSAAANRRHAQRVRAEVDAIGVGVGHGPRRRSAADGARSVYRDRPLTRVVFDRRLRTPPTARVFSTLDAGPVIIVTTPRAAPQADRVRAALEGAGAEIEVGTGDAVRRRSSGLATRRLGSLLLEGGAALHAAAWDAGRGRLRAAVRRRRTSLGDAAVVMVASGAVFDRVARRAPRSSRSGRTS